MVKRFYAGSCAASKTARGFTLIEMLVSIAIIAIMTTIVIQNLGTAQQGQQLITAARVIAGDIRSQQASALTAQNIPTCSNGSKNITCALSVISCVPVGSCKPFPPYAVGLAFKSGVAQTRYALFADVDSSSRDYLDTGAGEEYLMHDLAGAGAPNVVVSSFTLTPTVTPTPTEVDVAFDRQSGQAHITCPGAGCVGTTLLTINLKQTQSGATSAVDFNPLTGRASFQ